jgi:hypothetical protein
MVKYLIILITIFTLLLSNCDKEIEYPAAPIHFAGDQAFGWSTATKNGQVFEASGAALVHTERPDDFLGIELRTFTDWVANRETIYIAELDYSLGVYQIVEQDDDQENGVPIGFYTTTSDDGDVLEDVYKLDSRQDNWIEITAIDTLIGEPTFFGKYNIHFKIDRDKTNPLNPDHVRFIDGTFEVRFEQ